MTSLEVTSPAPVADDEPSLMRGIVAGDRSLFEQLMRRQNVVPILSSSTDINIDTMAAQDSDRPDKILGRAQVRGRAQMRALLERKLDELPEAFRLVFVLRSVEDMSVEDTARCLGIPEATVRSRQFRAKSLLRESLAQEIDLAERDAFEFAGAQCDAVVAKVLARLMS